LVRGQVLKADRFGNLLTNLTAEHLPEKFTAQCGGVTIAKKAKSYAEGQPGEVFFILGSSGFYEISVRQGSAAEVIGGRRGLEVVVSRI
jgi:S-adenosylmethionine hydrolase